MAHTAPKNMMTIDVEDWYHCLDQDPRRWSRYEARIGAPVRQLLEIFARTQTRATFFVLGQVAEGFGELVREIHAAGHEVATHGYEHRFIYRQRPDEFAADVRRSIDLLAAITGVPVRSYRAPYFSITQKSLWALPVLQELGIQCDSSIHPVLNHRYGIARAPRLPHRTAAVVLEVPVTTYPIAGPINLPCGGGVYFRVQPYWLVRRLFARLQRRGEPLVFYLHPWELDYGQPRIQLPWSLRVRHYWGLEKTAGKLERLCRDFPFTSIQEALGDG